MRVFVFAAYQFSMYKYRFFESSDLNHAYLTHDVKPIRSGLIQILEFCYFRVRGLFP